MSLIETRMQALKHTVQEVLTFPLFEEMESDSDELKMWIKLYNLLDDEGHLIAKISVKNIIKILRSVQCIDIVTDEIKRMAKDSIGTTIKTP